jgi:hypothetical protein
MTPENSKSRTVQNTRSPPGFGPPCARLRLSALIGIAILEAWLRLRAVLFSTA